MEDQSYSRSRRNTVGNGVQTADPEFRRWLKRNDIFQKDLLIELLKKNVVCADDISTITKQEFDDIVKETKKARLRDNGNARTMKRLETALSKFYKLWKKESGAPRSHVDWDGWPRTPKTNREPTMFPGQNLGSPTSPRLMHQLSAANSVSSEFFSFDWAAPQHIAFPLEANPNGFSLDFGSLEIDLTPDETGRIDSYLGPTSLASSPSIDHDDDRPPVGWYEGRYGDKPCVIFSFNLIVGGAEYAMRRRASSKTRSHATELLDRFERLSNLETDESFVNIFGYINREESKSSDPQPSDPTTTLPILPPDLDFAIIGIPLGFPQDEQPILVSEITRSDEKPEIAFSDKVLLIRRIVDAVLHLHQNGMCHGFVATDCVLIDSSLESVQLMPIVPIRRILEDDSLRNRSYRLYLAPETMTSNELTVESDLYMLGTLIWEILAQDDPFFGVASATESNIKRGWHPNIDHVTEKLSGVEAKFRPAIQKLVAIMKLLWSRTPSRRPSGQALRDKLVHIRV